MHYIDKFLINKFLIFWEAESLPTALEKQVEYLNRIVLPFISS